MNYTESVAVCETLVDEAEKEQCFEKAREELDAQNEQCNID
jgi:hypothetical protein